MSAPVATVVIPTKNRRADVLRAVESCRMQSVPVEVIVCDDGSTDGTAEAIRDAHPWVIVMRNETSIGSTINRNRAVERASTNYIISLDDDSAFCSPNTVAQTLADFDHPRVGAVAIPFCNIMQCPTIWQSPPDREDIWVYASYRGCAAAWRRDVFRHIGGYSAVLGHYVEESELGYRLVAAGFIVRLGRAEHLNHYESPRRDTDHIAYLYGRNHVLRAWINVPWPHLAWMLPGTCLSTLRSSTFGGRRLAAARGELNALATMARGKAPRKALSRRAWRAIRVLARSSQMRLRDFEALLPDQPPALSASMAESLSERPLAGSSWSRH